MKRKRSSESSSSSKSSGCDDELNYILKSYSKPKKKYSRKTNHLLKKYKKSSSSSSSESSEIVKDRYNRIDHLLSKIDKNKMILDKPFMDVSDNIVEIEKVYNSPNEFPRADGLVFKDPLFNKRYPERYGRDWIKQLTDRQRILESDLNYKFLVLIAGKIESDVWTLIHDKNLEEVVKTNQQIMDIIRKERERIIVPTDKKRDQILIIESIIEKDKIKYDKFNTMLLKNLKILQKGQLLIDSGQNKDIPDKLHDQGLLYVLKLEDEFSSFIDLLDALILHKYTNKEKSDTTYKEKLIMVNKKIKEITNELYGCDDDDFNMKYHPNFDKEVYEYIYYNVLLFLKYYLNCMYNDNGIYQPPKIRILKRFKYLINVSLDVNNDEEIENLIDQVNNDFKDSDDFELLNQTIAALLSKYNFTDTQKQKLINLKIASPKFIDLINPISKSLNTVVILNLFVSQIYQIDWDLIYGNELINLRNFIILFTPKEPEYNNTLKLLYSLAIIGCKNDATYINIVNSHQKDSTYDIYNDKYDLTYLKEHNENIYNLIVKIKFTNTSKNLTFILISHFVYSFFMMDSNNIYEFINKIWIIFKSNPAIDKFYNYYKMDIMTTDKLVPFIIDSKTIKYMKDLYYITLNSYLFDIVTILYEDNIINFPSDIIKLIKTNVKKDKINASFYQILNESMNNIEIKIIDPEFQKFIDSFSNSSIHKKKDKEKNLHIKKNIKFLQELAEIPTESLNINKQYSGVNPIINLHLYYTLYIESLKFNLVKLKSGISKSERAINEAKDIISNVSSEKLDIRKIEEKFRDTYQNPLEWVVQPFNSGILVIKESIIAAITDAFYKLKLYAPGLSDITLPVIICAHECGLTIQFATLVSYIIKQQRMNSPSQYYKVSEITYNFKDLTKKVLDIIKGYRYTKSTTTQYNNGFLGTVYFQNRGFHIRYPVDSNDQISPYANLSMI